MTIQEAIATGQPITRPGSGWTWRIERSNTGSHARFWQRRYEWQRARNASLRAELLKAYGGQCACCGESQPIFLDLDHIENDGAAHRREVGNSAQVMLQLRAAGWPRDRFQLLCCNCNQGKTRNGGVCPHANAQ